MFRMKITKIPRMMHQIAKLKVIFRKDLVTVVQPVLGNSDTTWNSVRLKISCCTNFNV